MKTEHVDILIVGAGISGIAAAYYIQEQCPEKSYTIFEGRDNSGGTWDLFRYPGIRSDSDMHTLGYSFNSWTDARGIANGEDILMYLRDTARRFGITRHLRFNHRVCQANWSSRVSKWRVSAQNSDGQIVEISCDFLFMCTGYYDYAEGYTPHWESLEDFKGSVIHPQNWSDDIDYENKNVVVIGSGATAITLVPALAGKASHVTMLQRSPTYIMSLPSESKIDSYLHKLFPAKIAHPILRWKSILIQMLFYQFSRRFPQAARKTIFRLTRQKLKDSFDVERHFSPEYNPWDQRVCMVPDDDLFNVINEGKASVVTDQIDQFTESGVLLKSGKELDAEIIITATGLKVVLMNGIELYVDNQQVNVGDKLSYKGMMYSDVPNLFMAFGYTNASWTLKCELISKYACRLINYMDEHDYAMCVPRLPRNDLETSSSVALNSSYIQRSKDNLPKQGDRKPWKIYENYILDIFNFRFTDVNDGTMQFSRQENKEI